MNDYFLYALVIGIAVMIYLYNDEKKRHSTTKVELDLLKERRNLDELNKALSSDPLGSHPIPPDMFDYVGTRADTGRDNASGDAEAQRPRTVFKGL